MWTIIIINKVFYGFKSEENPSDKNNIGQIRVGHLPLSFHLWYIRTRSASVQSAVESFKQLIKLMTTALASCAMWYKIKLFFMLKHFGTSIPFQHCCLHQGKQKKHNSFYSRMQIIQNSFKQADWSLHPVWNVCYSYVEHVMIIFVHSIAWNQSWHLSPVSISWSD